MWGHYKILVGHFLESLQILFENCSLTINKLIYNTQHSKLTQNWKVGKNLVFSHLYKLLIYYSNQIIPVRGRSIRRNGRCVAHVSNERAEALLLLLDTLCIAVRLVLVGLSLFSGFRLLRHDSVASTHISAFLDFGTQLTNHVVDFVRFLLLLVD